MRPLDRETVARVVRAREVRGADGLPLPAVFTDTRRPVPGGLFVALVGETHDAHAFLGPAVAAGAGGIVVSRPSLVPTGLHGGVFVAVVDDTLAALQDLAAEVRRRLTARVVAVTGSVGKTTVKDMTASALSAHGKVGRTPGNWNNEVGVPLSLFAMDGDEDLLVLEEGMSAPGEIAALTRLSRPDVGVVTAAAAAHLAFFPSVDAIADAKCEMYEALPPGAVGVANADDPRILPRARRIRPEGLVTYGVADGATVRVASVTQDADGTGAEIDVAGRLVRVRLRVLGRHNAANAAAALAAVHALGLDPAPAAEALSAGFAPGAHRMVVLRAPGGLTVLDDCYNANPASVRAALQALADVAPGALARGAVLGSMLELGAEADALHDEIGAFAATSGLTWLAATGPHAAALAHGARRAGLSEIHTADDAADLADEVRAFAGPGRWLLLKGSRGQRLERLLAPLGLGEGG